MRRPPLRRRSAVAGIALLATLLALAEGGARAAPTIDPTVALGIDAAYDSNVYFFRGPDYVTRITPRIAARVHDPRLDLKVSYDVGIWLYALGRVGNSVNHQGRFVLERSVTRRLILKLADEIIYARDPGFLLRAGVIAPQTSIFDNVLDAELDFLFTRRLAGAVSYSFRHTSFGAPPPGAALLFDGEEHNAAAALDFRATRRDDLRLWNRFTYYNANGAGLALTDAPALGFHHRFLRWIDLRADGGPLFFDVLDGGRVLSAANAARQSGITWRGAAVLRLITPSFRATVSATRDLVGGTGAASVLWAEYVSARLGWRPLRMLDLQAGASVFANGFAPSEPRLYDGVTADALVDVIPVPGFHLGAYYNFRWQEELHPGAAPLPGVSRHVVGIRVVAAWGDEARPLRRRRE